MVGFVYYNINLQKHLIDALEIANYHNLWLNIVIRSFTVEESG